MGELLTLSHRGQQDGTVPFPSSLLVWGALPRDGVGCPSGRPFPARHRTSPAWSCSRFQSRPLSFPRG